MHISIISLSGEIKSETIVKNFYVKLSYRYIPQNFSHAKVYGITVIFVSLLKSFPQKKHKKIDIINVVFCLIVK